MKPADKDRIAAAALNRRRTSPTNSHSYSPLGGRADERQTRLRQSVSRSMLGRTERVEIAGD